MGCKQTTTKSPSIIFATSPTSPTIPVYVKSALKKTGINGKGKTEKLSFLKKRPPTLTKSVNFDEKVQVKVRTPTPKQTRSENTSSTKIGTRQPSNDNGDDDDDDDDDDGQLSSISSQEDIHNDQVKTSTTPSNASLQRNQPNGFWYKNNSVAVLPSTNNTKETNQQPSVNTTTRPVESPTIPIGNRFRVRRKVQYAVLPQISGPSDPNQSPATPSHRPTVQPSPLPVQRSLQNTNAVLLEHRTPFPSDGSSPQTTYYAFSRRPADKTTSTEK